MTRPIMGPRVIGSCFSPGSFVLLARFEVVMENHIVYEATSCAERDPLPPKERSLLQTGSLYHVFDRLFI